MISCLQLLPLPNQLQASPLHQHTVQSRGFTRSVTTAPSCSKTPNFLLHGGHLFQHFEWTIFFFYSLSLNNMQITSYLFFLTTEYLVIFLSHTHHPHPHHFLIITPADFLKGKEYNFNQLKMFFPSLVGTKYMHMTELLLLPAKMPQNISGFKE